MNGHTTTEMLHDFVEGLLEAEDRLEVEAHVASCAACAEQAREFEALLAAMGGLPANATVPEGLWEGIEARMGRAEGGPSEDGATRVLAFPSERRAGSHRYTLSLSQLAAAASVIAVLSAGVVWAVLGTGTPAATPVATIEGPAPRGAARLVSAGDASYVTAASELEALLEQGRGVLAPETLAAIESSLGTIDAAIADVERALRADPSSELLGRMLVSHQGARLRVLRQAVRQVQGQI